MLNTSAQCLVEILEPGAATKLLTTFQNFLLQGIIHAAEMGHRETTEFLIKTIRELHPGSGTSNQSSSALHEHGFTELHLMALSQEDTLPRMTVSVSQNFILHRGGLLLEGCNGL